MALNQYVNKVEANGQTLIDLTADTAVASDVAVGKYFHLATGERVQGANSGGSAEAGTVTQDAQGYLVLDDQPGSGSVTVEALNVTANGTYTAPTGKAYSPVTVSVSGGGGGDMHDPIRFFDYDGTLVASYTAVPSSLPSVPTHTGLTNGSWNYTLAQVTTQFNAMGSCDVGANYDTSSGATEIEIELPEGRLDPYIAIAVNGTVEIDWGDNSTPTTSTGTSITTRLSNVHHQYAAAGSYTIKIRRTSGDGYGFYTTSTYSILNKNSSVSGASRVYAACVKKVRIGDYCSLNGTYIFYYCTSLETVSIPSSISLLPNYTFGYCVNLKFASIPSNVTSATVGGNLFYECRSLIAVSIPSSFTSIPEYMLYSCTAIESVSIPSEVATISQRAFQGCSIKSIKIPSGVSGLSNYLFASCYCLVSVDLPSNLNSIGQYVFQNCYALESINLPSTLTSIGASSFYSCTALKSISIPSSVTTINSSAFYQCDKLAVITIPSGVTTINTNTFYNCLGMKEYHFLRSESVPTLSNKNAFNLIQSDCIFYVPSSKLADYQAASLWSDYASRMVGE